MRKLKGSLSIFVAVIFVLIASLLLTLIDAVLVTGSVAMADMVNSLSVESAFSKYDRVLFEEYGVFMLRNEENALEDDIIAYIEDNLDVGNSLINISLKDVRVEKTFRPTAINGALVENQIVNYSKYAIPVRAGTDIVNKIMGFEKNNPTKKITDSIVELTGEVYEVNENVYLLMMYIDGVSVDGTTIQREGGRVVSTDVFAKMVSVDESFAGMGIDDIGIYKVIKDKLNNPLDMLRQIDTLYRRYCITKSDSTYKTLMESVNEYAELMKNTYLYYGHSLKICNTVIGKSQDIAVKAQTMETILEASKGLIDEELYKGLKTEIDNYKDMGDVKSNMLCDVNQIAEKLERNSEVIEYALELCDYDFSDTDEANEIAVRSCIETVKRSFVDFRVDDINIDYKGINQTDEEESDILKSLEGLYKKGVIHLVLGDKSVSGKKLPAEYIIATHEDRMYTGSDDMVKNVLFNEYVLEKFASATDNAAGNSLDYEIEYILQGRRSDEENLSETLKDLIRVRTGANLAYLFTDTEKQTAAYNLALSIASGLGTPGAATPIKISILSVWAYGEGIIDARLLLEGKAVDFMKTKSGWNLSFENLLKFDFSGGKGTESKYGLKYEDYLRYLLYQGSYTVKNGAVINLMELHMKKLDDTFSMRNMVVAADIITEYKYMGKVYTNESTFSY